MVRVINITDVTVVGELVGVYTYISKTFTEQFGEVDLFVGPFGYYLWEIASNHTELPIHAFVLSKSPGFVNTEVSFLV